MRLQRQWSVSYILRRWTLVSSLLCSLGLRSFVQVGSFSPPPPLRQPFGPWLLSSSRSSLSVFTAAESNVNIGTTTTTGRKRQVRRRSTNRRPRFYWRDPNNLRKELCQFWSDRGVELLSVAGGNSTAATRSPPLPPIPNEVLLMYYQRHDLRAAIRSLGGRTRVSHLLGGAPIIPGPWQEAVRTSWETRALIARDAHLSADRPPAVTTTRTTVSTTTTTKISLTTSRSSSRLAPQSSPPPRRWSHQSGRKPKGYWSLQAVIRELYQYLDEYRQRHHRPAVWMPRPSELSHCGRDDLKQAMTRFGGGAARVQAMAGLVPYQEWYYFEGQLELLQELHRYLKKEHDKQQHDTTTTSGSSSSSSSTSTRRNSNFAVFPTVEDVRRNGYDKLHALIQYYGGRKFLAARLGMTATTSSGSTGGQEHQQNNGSDVFLLSWGAFDLEFAIRLLLFVRNEQLQKSPPLARPTIAIPSPYKLLQSGPEGEWLEARIREFGGYENVARRLGLAFSSE